MNQFKPAEAPNLLLKGMPVFRPLSKRKLRLLTYYASLETIS